MPTENEILNTELDQILEELGVASVSDDDNEALAMLGAELAGTEFDMGGKTDAMAMLGMDDDPELQELVFGIIVTRARRLIQQLIALARRYRNCPRCIGLVTQAVALFKAKKYVQAIATGTRAVQCFRSCSS